MDKVQVAGHLHLLGLEHLSSFPQVRPALPSLQLVDDVLPALKIPACQLVVWRAERDQRIGGVEIGIHLGSRLT